MASIDKVALMKRATFSYRMEPLSPKKWFVMPMLR